jgi:hypothetical protein
MMAVCRCLLHVHTPKVPSVRIGWCAPLQVPAEARASAVIGATINSATTKACFKSASSLRIATARVHLEAVVDPCKMKVCCYSKVVLVCGGMQVSAGQCGGHPSPPSSSSASFPVAAWLPADTIESHHPSDMVTQLGSTQSREMQTPSEDESWPISLTSGSAVPEQRHSSITY